MLCITLQKSAQTGIYTIHSLFRITSPCLIVLLSTLGIMYQHGRCKCQKGIGVAKRNRFVLKISKLNGQNIESVSDFVLRDETN